MAEPKTLHDVLVGNDIEQLKQLIADKSERELFNFRTTNERSESPVHTTINHAHNDICFYLLDQHYGKELAEQQDFRGETALHRSSWCGRVEMTQKLLDLKLDVNVVNTLGLTPLHLAAERAHVEIVKLLVLNKANVNAQSLQGNTPLHRAMATKNKKLVSLLINANALPELTNSKGIRAGLKNTTDELVNMAKKLSETEDNVTISSLQLDWDHTKDFISFTKEEIMTLVDIENTVNLITKEENVDLTMMPQLGDSARKFSRWKEILTFLEEKKHEFIEGSIKRNQKYSQKQQEIEDLDKKVKKTMNEFLNAKKQLEESKNQFIILQSTSNVIDERLNTLNKLTQTAEELSKKEDNFELEFNKLIRQKSIQDMTVKDLKYVLWKMGLSHCYGNILKNEIDGSMLAFADESVLLELGFSTRDSCCLLYQRGLMTRSRYLESYEDEQESCIVCSHDTPQKTINLLNEYDITLNPEIITSRNWLAPHLLYITRFSDEFNVPVKDTIRIRQLIVNLWSNAHQTHLERLGDDLFIKRTVREVDTSEEPPKKKQLLNGPPSSHYVINLN